MTHPPNHRSILGTGLPDTSARALHRHGTGTPAFAHLGTGVAATNPG